MTAGCTDAGGIGEKVTGKTSLAAGRTCSSKEARVEDASSSWAVKRL